jgi:UDP-N-acetylmuramoyl-L-alanyl-D-glutamate--2,6-diaminopimelate ligase
MIVNADDKNANYFLRFKANEIWLYGIKKKGIHELPHYENAKKLRISGYKLHQTGIEFIIGNKSYRSPLRGEFNLYNILASICFAKSQSIGWDVIRNALEVFAGIPGRVEIIKEGQDFKVVVDYAHTPESLEKVYDLFQRSRRICVLGSTGGGRDKWKREIMGRIADAHCDEIILTNEDPYDEDPERIIEDIKQGVGNRSKCKTIISRRKAISEAIKMASTGDTVLITGKGTDPWIMGARGARIRWDDRVVVRRELRKLLKEKNQ